MAGAGRVSRRVLMMLMSLAVKLKGDSTKEKIRSLQKQKIDNNTGTSQDEFHSH
jgi:hypothetical protein